MIYTLKDIQKLAGAGWLSDLFHLKGHIMRLKAKKLLIIAAAAAALFAFSSCGKAPASDATVFRLNKDGSVTHIIVEKNEDSIDQEELTAYINSQINAYGTGEEENPVELKSCRADINGITIEMQYASINDYAAFNNVPAFDGSLEEAVKNGFGFGSGFTSESGLAYSGYTLPVEYPGLQVLVLQEPMNVIIPQSALLVSDNIQKNSDGTYKITESEVGGIPEVFRSVNAEPAYIVYKTPSR